MSEAAKKLGDAQIQERINDAEDALKNEKIKLSKDVFKRAEEGMRNINEKLENNLPIYESDFEFVEELNEVVKIGQQYREAMENLKRGGLYNPEKLIKRNKKAPTMEEVIQIVRTKLTKEQKEAINKMQKPVLQIVPNRTCGEYVTALDKNKPMVDEKGKAQANARVSDWAKNAFRRAGTRDNAEYGRIMGWKVVITEGVNAPAILDGDDVSKTLGERWAWYKENFEKKGISGIDFKSYMLLQMAGFAKNPPRPIDDTDGEDNTWTMLNAERIFNGSVAGANWNDYNTQVDIFADRIENENDYARFRVAVMVKI
ncbi:MAG: hypothetical protein WCT53_05665 [Candidatus Gracilibacteria bacterium]